MVTSETHHEPKYLRLWNKITYKQLPSYKDMNDLAKYEYCKMSKNVENCGM